MIEFSPQPMRAAQDGHAAEFAGNVVDDFEPEMGG